MALRCLLFSSDEKTAQPVRQVLGALDIEAEYCPTAVEAVQAVTNQAFQLVVVDWDDQPEAAFLLNTARERKAAERPMTLAIVANDANVPQALQAGANSILRKPVQAQQAKDTLTTARTLLRAKQNSAAPMAKAAAAAASAAASAAVSHPDMDVEPTAAKPLRAGEFLQPSTAPSAQFDIHTEITEAAAPEVDPLEELEPMASAVQAKATTKSVPLAPPASAPEPEAAADDGPRGLEWYLKNRSGAAPGVMQHAAASAPAPAPAKPELLSFDQTPAAPGPPAHETIEAAEPINFSARQNEHKSEQKEEAALFAYIDGEEPADKSKASASRPWMRKAVLAGIMAAVVAIAYVAVPKSVWHENVRLIAINVFHAGHNWLNPQPVTPAQAPVSHESFGRAGDEYKLPVAETIPDATTDPSQIRVVPVVDPNAKQANGAAAQTAPGTDPFTPPADGQQPAAATPTPDSSASQTSTPSAQGPVTPNAVAPNVEAAGSQPAATPAQAPATTTAVEPPPTHAPAPAQIQTTAPAPAPQVPAQQKSAPTANSGIPTSLKSQMATSTPEASGNKPVEAALPSIEPVELPEATARNLILDQSQPPYPDGAKGQTGTVVLAVLIGRDGSVQDAKFLQGSLAFARGAIDGVKQWKFKPYLLNNRPVSVQTLLTLTFKPGV